MLVEANLVQEKRELEQLMNSNSQVRHQYDLFRAEMDFKQKLIDIRKENELTQKEVSKASGLTQQAVSRLERGQGATIETVIKYLGSMGYTLGVTKV